MYKLLEEIFQEKNFKLNRELNPGPLACHHYAVQIQVLEEARSLSLECLYETHLISE